MRKVTELFALRFAALQRRDDDLNLKAADMWSYAIVLWELSTREVPFADMSPMEIGMKVRDGNIHGWIMMLSFMFCYSLYRVDSLYCACAFAGGARVAARDGAGWHRAAHVAPHSDLHERGRSQATALRHGHPDS